MYERWLHLSDEQRIERYDRLQRLRDASLRSALRKIKTADLHDGK